MADIKLKGKFLSMKFNGHNGEKTGSLSSFSLDSLPGYFDEMTQLWDYNTFLLQTNEE